MLLNAKVIVSIYISPVMFALFRARVSFAETGENKTSRALVGQNVCEMPDLFLLMCAILLTFFS